MAKVKKTGVYDIPLEPKYIAKRIDTSLGRAYVMIHKGELVMSAYAYSATTLLNVIDKGIGFLKFFSQGYEQAQSYSMYRAWIGTLVHEFLEQLLYGKKIDLSKTRLVEPDYRNKHIAIGENVPPEVDIRVQAFVDWWNTLKNPEIIAIELLLFHPDHYVAGTLDLLIKVDGKVLLIDFKTGKQYEKTQSIQLTYYKDLVQMIYEIEVDEIGCLFLTDRGTAKYVQMNYVPEIAEITYHLFRYKNSSFKTEKLPKIKEPEEKSRIFKL